MSFNALSNVARKKTKWKKIQKSTIFTKVDGKVVIRSSILTAPQRFFNAGTSQITCALKSTVKSKLGWFSTRTGTSLIWRRKSARKGLNSTSGAQFAAHRLVKPVVWLARAVVNWRSLSVAKSAYCCRGVGWGETIIKGEECQPFTTHLTTTIVNDDWVCFSNRVQIFY